MPLFRRAMPLLLVAVLSFTARAGVVAPASASAPVYAPPAGAWSAPLGAAFADPAVSALLPQSLSGLDLKSPDALRVTAPLVQSLSVALSVTPEAFAAMEPAARKAAVELAAEDAREHVRSKAYELVETARAASSPGKAMDKEGRAELYGAVSKLMEMRQFYGPWLDEDTTAAVEDGYKLVSARAWEVRTFLIQRDEPGVVAKPDKPAAAAAAIPLYVLDPSGAAVKIRADMSNNKSGWGQSDFDTLYTGYDFVLRQGGKHRFYSHPVFPQLTASVSRQNDLPPGYAQTALKDLAELERLVAAQHTAAAAPATGPPATLTLADLSILLSQPKPKAEKTRPVVQDKTRPVVSRVPARVQAKTVPDAPVPPKIVPQLAPATPRVVEPAPEPPAVTAAPEKRKGLIERIRGVFRREQGDAN